MTGKVASIWRYPIKSHGRESLLQTTLKVGHPLPWDRHWAVQHNQSDHDGTGWVSCQNFMIGARTPELAALTATLDIENRQITLMHNAHGVLTFRPDDNDDSQRFLTWIRSIIPQQSMYPFRIVSAGERGLTDSTYASVSIMNTASHRAISQKLEQPIETERWRANIWLEELAPGEEFDWIDQEIRIGTATLIVRERIERCLHTAANPWTGKRDINILRLLEDGWHHRDFGVYAEVIHAGTIGIGDSAAVVS